MPYYSGCRRGRTDIIESESPCPEVLKEKNRSTLRIWKRGGPHTGAVRTGGETEPEEKVRRTARRKGTLLLPVQMCTAPPRFQGISTERKCAH